MASTRPQTPKGVNHLVLNVRDIGKSHEFYTDILGFEQCGELGDHIPMTMKFYRSSPQSHHDVALVQLANPEEAGPVKKWDIFNASGAINHIAVCFADRDTWLKQLDHLKANDVEFLMRGDHGMTHSAYIADPDGNGIEVLYELPAEVWEGDLNAALNYFDPKPLEGPESLEDTTDYKRFEPTSA